MEEKEARKLKRIKKFQAFLIKNKFYVRYFIGDGGRWWGDKNLIERLLHSPSSAWGGFVSSSVIRGMWREEMHDEYVHELFEFIDQHGLHDKLIAKTAFGSKMKMMRIAEDDPYGFFIRYFAWSKTDDGPDFWKEINRLWDIERTKI